MPVPNKLAALTDAIEQVSNLINENEALLDEVARLRADLIEERASVADAAKAYAKLSQRMHRWLLVPGVVDALTAYGEPNDL